MNFSELKSYLDQLPQEWGVPACSMVIRHGRETVFEHYVNAQSDDVYWLYSATKPFTATLFCRLLEQGKIHLEDRVSDYLPEYAHLTVQNADKSLRDAVVPMTVEHLITMCGGLTYQTNHPCIVNAQDRSTRGIVKEIANMPLIADPGETFYYSLCHDVLAAVMEVITGKRFADMIKQEITEPLGMKNTEFHPDADLNSRIVQQYRWDSKIHQPKPCPITNSFLFSDTYDSGGAGLCSTMNDYVLLPEALSNGGKARSGYQLLRPETIENMRTNRILTAGQREGFDRRWGPRLGSYGYGLGVRTRIDHKDNGLSPLGEFGWDGAAGAYCLADPDNQISAFYVQHILDMGSVYDTIHPKLRDLIYKGLNA